MCKILNLNIGYISKDCKELEIYGLIDLHYLGLENKTNLIKFLEKDRFKRREKLYGKVKTKIIFCDEKLQ